MVHYRTVTNFHLNLLFKLKQQLNFIHSSIHNCHTVFRRRSTQRKMMQAEPINGKIQEYKDASRKRVMLQIRNKVELPNEGNFSHMYSALMTRISKAATTNDNDGNGSNNDDDKQQKKEEKEAPTIPVALKEITFPKIMKKDPNSKVKEHNSFYEIFLLRLLATYSPHKRIIELLYTRRRESEENKLKWKYTLVFPLVPSNLKEQRVELSKQRNLLDIKLYTWQLFSGLDHLRKLRIMHRDMKPGNLLVDPATGQLKIADFGSAGRVRYYYSNFNLAKYAVTRPYRPPEILLWAQYDFMIDVWSAGCIFIELFLGRTLFQTDPEERKSKMWREMLQMIYKLLGGAPSPDELRAMKVDPQKFELEKFVPLPLVDELSAKWPTMQGLKSEIIKIGFKDANIPMGLFNRILQYVPGQRLHGLDLLRKPFFAELFETGKMRQNNTPIRLSIDPSLDFRSIWGTEV